MSEFRPTKFSDVIGQANVKACLNIAISSCKQRNDVVSHLLFLGPPGTGKTTLAEVTANELGNKFYRANGGNIKNLKDVLPYLSRCKRGDILFIDEVHRVHTRVQEALFTVMEDFRLDLAKGAMSINFEPFTIIGATTDSGLLLRPFYDRFINQLMLEDYTLDELQTIISNNCRKLKVVATDSAIMAMATRCRFTPRIANSILQFCRDYTIVDKTGGDIITDSMVEQAMALKKIDKKGLDFNDRRYIMKLKDAGRPLGLNTIAGMTGIPKETIENQIEPFLLKLGMIEKTTKGRRLL